MFLDRVALHHQVVVESHELLVLHAEAVDIAPNVKQLNLHGLQLAFWISNFVAHVCIALICYLQLSLHFFILVAEAIIITFEYCDIAICVLVMDAGVCKIFFFFVKLVLFAVQVVISLLDQSTEVFDSRFHPVDVAVQMRKFVSHDVWLLALLLKNLLVALDLSPHLCSLHLLAIDIVTDCTKGLLVVLNQVALGDKFFLNSGCIICLVVDTALGPL